MSQSCLRFSIKNNNKTIKRFTFTISFLATSPNPCPATLSLPHYTLTTLASFVLQGYYPLSYLKDFANAVPASRNAPVWPATSQPRGLTLDVWTKKVTCHISKKRMLWPSGHCTPPPSPLPDCAPWGD